MIDWLKSILQRRGARVPRRWKFDCIEYGQGKIGEIAVTAGNETDARMIAIIHADPMWIVGPAEEVPLSYVSQRRPIEA